MIYFISWLVLGFISNIVCSYLLYLYKNESFTVATIFDSIIFSIFGPIVLIALITHLVSSSDVLNKFMKIEILPKKD